MPISVKDANGSIQSVSTVDEAVGLPTNPEATSGNGTAIGILKRLRSLISDATFGLSSRASEATVTSLNNKIPSPIGGKIPVDTNLSPLTDTQLRANPVEVDTNLLQGITQSQSQSISDGSIGLPTNTESLTDGTVISLLKRIRTLLGDLTTRASETTLSSLNTKIPSQVGGKIPVETNLDVVSQVQSQAISDGSVGLPTNVEQSGDGTVIAIIKRIRTLLADLTILNTKIPSQIGGKIPVDTDLEPLTQTQSQSISDGSIGLPTNTESLTDGTVISLLKRIRTLLGDLTTRATEATLSAINAKTPALTTSIPDSNVSTNSTRIVPQEIFNFSFSEVGTVITPQFTTPIVSNGATFSQASGALLVNLTATANSEFLTRSRVEFKGSMRAALSTVISARNANNVFQWQLGDLVGENLNFNIVNATTLDVTLTAHGFTTVNVGQRMNICGIVSAVAAVAGRYAIASIPDVDTIRFTVAGFPTSGTGTCTLMGYNQSLIQFSGATATTTTFGTARRGWAQLADNAATGLLTTASPGAIHRIEYTGREVFFMEHLRASTSTPTITTRASRYEDIPDDDVPLYLWIWARNTGAAVASTWTISSCSVEKYSNIPVYLQGNRAVGATNPIPVSFPSAQNVAFATAQAVTLASTTLSGSGNNVTPQATTNLIGDVGIQYRATAGLTSRAHLVSAASANATNLKPSAGKLLGYYFVNTNAAFRYVKFHNSSGIPTAGAGVILTVGIPPNGRVDFMMEGGIAFATGIAITTVTGAADSDATGVGLNDIVGDIFFA